MEDIVKFAIEDIQIIKNEDYSIDEFAIARIGFLSSRPNSHKLKISDKVLIDNAPTVLGKFLVAEIDPITEDATSHSPNEVIYGYFPKEQNVIFEEEEDGYIRAYAEAVVSKIYAPSLCKIFENGDTRSVSVEMTIETVGNQSLDDEVESFNIVGVTVLGKDVQPSCFGSDIIFTRFSEKNALEYFNKNKDVVNIKKFAEERRKIMEEKYLNHPINTSKDAIYDGDWDGDKSKHDLIKEKNFTSLAPKVCLRLEDGWEDREVSKLGYPVMCLHDGEWVYSKKGLASAMGYAKQHDDNDIVNKVEKLYDKLGLDSDGKGESAKMNEIEFSAVNIGEMWGKLFDALHAKYPDGDYGSVYYVDSIWEEDNKKFALIHKKDENELYRLDFSYTEEGLSLADEIIKVEIAIVETDSIKKFEKPENLKQECQECDMEENSDDENEHDEKDCDENCEEDNNENIEMDSSQMLEKIAELEDKIKSYDLEIQEKEAELEELRNFKSQRLEQDKALAVGAVLNSVEDFMDKTELEACRSEGMSCDFSQIDAWANKVKASIVDKAIKQSKKKTTDFTKISGGFDYHEEKKPMSVWDKIK